MVEATGVDRAIPSHEQASSSVQNEKDTTRPLEAAGLFLEQHRDLNVDDIDLTKLRHKIDRVIIPLMVITYVLAFLDKAIYNYTPLMGIKKDLHFRPADFSNIATASAITHVIFQFPNTYFLQRFPAGKWLSGSVVAWGTVTALTAAVHDVRGFYVVRVFLAVFEATISPSLMLITAQWYNKREQAPRYAFWHAAPGIGQVIGALLSYGFQGVPKNYAVSGWRLMFIALGIVTVLMGIVDWFLLPDSPMTARFLNDREKVALLRHVSVNMTGVENRKVNPRQLWEAAKDAQVWLLSLGLLLSTMSTGLTMTYSTTLIKAMGFSSRKSALLNMPTGVIGVICNLFVGWGIRKTSYRFAWAMGTCIPAIVGASLLSFLRQSNLTGGLVGLYMITGSNGIITVAHQWSMANVSGGTKRAVMAAVLNVVVGLASIIAPQTFQERDRKGGYIPAKVTVIVTQGLAAVVYLMLYLYYLAENKRRNRRAHVHGIGEAMASDTTLTEEDAWGGMTDKENWTKFRYIY